MAPAPAVTDLECLRCHAVYDDQRLFTGCPRCAALWAETDRFAQPVSADEASDAFPAWRDHERWANDIEETQGGAKLHPADPLKRAEHRAWMEFGSAILGDLWGLETTADPATFENKRQALVAKFARVEAALGAGPFCAGEAFSLVDAVFAPIFRYFDLFDELTEHGIFTDVPKVRAWRAELAKRPSVRTAAGEDYPQLLRAFLVRHEAHLLRLAA